jgi:hypothetical protein
MATIDLQKHARVAMSRATSDLEDLKCELKKASQMSRPHRLAIEESVLDLERHLSVLTDRFNDMAGADIDQLPSSWRHFFAAYDDYLEAVRLTKCAMAREEYLDDLTIAAQLRASDGQAESEGK